MRDEDRIRLLHMREAEAKAIAMAEGLRREELASTRMLALALTRCLEIVGEAASRVSAETREQHPDLPYVEMIAMRNRLNHAYFDIDLDIPCTTVRKDLPPLVDKLDLILGSTGTRES